MLEIRVQKFISFLGENPSGKPADHNFTIAFQLKKDKEMEKERERVD